MARAEEDVPADELRALLYDERELARTRAAYAGRGDAADVARRLLAGDPERAELERRAYGRGDAVAASAAAAELAARARDRMALLAAFRVGTSARADTSASASTSDPVIRADDPAAGSRSARAATSGAEGRTGGRLGAALGRRGLRLAAGAAALALGAGALTGALVAHAHGEQLARQRAAAEAAQAAAAGGGYTANSSDGIGSPLVRLTSALGRPQRSFDELPAVAASGVEPASSRLVDSEQFGAGHHLLVFVARASTRTVCVVGVIDARTSARTCRDVSALDEPFSLTIRGADGAARTLRVVAGAIQSGTMPEGDG